MVVVECDPQSWYLFEADGKLFLDALCNHSFLYYNYMIELDSGEVQQYQKEGSDYLKFLARQIHLSAPGLKGSHSPYVGRNVSSTYRDKVTAAVDEYNRTKNSSPPTG